VLLEGWDLDQISGSGHSTQSALTHTLMRKTKRDLMFLRDRMRSPIVYDREGRDP